MSELKFYTDVNLNGQAARKVSLVSGANGLVLTSDEGAAKGKIYFGSAGNTYYDEAAGNLRITTSDNNSNIASFYAGAKQRSYIGYGGQQRWYLNTSADGSGTEVGQIAYLTPGSLPGIVFFNTSLTGRSQITQLASTGGLAFVASTSGSIGDAQMVLTTSGNIGIGTSSPATSALLELTSTTKGFLLPRMNKTQRNAISSPATGLVIFQTDNTPGLRAFNGANWVRYTETTD